MSNGEIPVGSRHFKVGLNQLLSACLRGTFFRGLDFCIRCDGGVTTAFTRITSCLVEQAESDSVNKAAVKHIARGLFMAWPLLLKLLFALSDGAGDSLRAAGV